MEAVLDVDALRQWADYDLPVDRDRWPGLLNQMRTDMAGAVERIDELERLLAEKAS